MKQIIIMGSARYVQLQQCPVIIFSNFVDGLIKSPLESNFTEHLLARLYFTNNGNVLQSE